MQRHSFLHYPRMFVRVSVCRASIAAPAVGGCYWLLLLQLLLLLLLLLLLTDAAGSKQWSRILSCMRKLTNVLVATLCVCCFLVWRWWFSGNLT